MPTPLLVALAGLPGSGKSSLARQLAASLPGAILDKDRLRAALFAPGEIEYSTRQDDLCFELMLQAAVFLLGKGRNVLLDGRTFARAYQVQRVCRFAAQQPASLRWIECVCPPEVARARLERDHGRHPAGNRSFALYEELRANADPLPDGRLVIDTSCTPQDCLQQALAFLRA